MNMAEIVPEGLPELDWDDLDVGIRDRVRILRDAGVPTVQSCQGGTGHPYAYPTIEFAGTLATALKALAVALEHGMRIAKLKAVYSLLEPGLPSGPTWQLEFYADEE